MIPRILVVDDDPLNLDLVRRRLDAHGYACTLVGTGQEGIDRASEQPYEAVLLDLRLPDVDGEQVLAAVHQKRPELPVVVMTAHGSQALRGQLLAAGAADYLVKPVRRQELIEVLERVIPSPRGQSEETP